MADPISLMAGGSMIASAASAGLGAYSALEGGESKRKTYEYQAGVATINKKIAQDNAAYALRTGERQALQLGMGQRQRMGKIIAGQAASGIDINSGTAVDVRTGQGQVDQMGQRQIRENAARKAYGHMVEAEGHSQSSILAQRAGADAEWAGKIGAAQSILGGVSSVASKWSQGAQLGMYGGGAPVDRHPYDVALDYLYA